MLKVHTLFAAAALILTTSTAFAKIEKAGTVKLNGEALNLKVSANFGSGTIVVGDEEYVVNDTSTYQVGGFLLIEKNGEVITDKKIQILFEDVQEIGAELRDFVSNSDEVECTVDSNAVVVISDDIANKLIGNCAVLN